MQKTHHTKNGFQNLSYTPQLVEGFSMWKVMKDFFMRGKSVLPPHPLPSVKTDLKNYYSDKPSVIWFGHSSYLIHSKEKNILVDPVLSGHASPFSWYIKAFERSDIYKIDDMPPIDLLIITHDHYDHLDLKTVKQLVPGAKQIIMPLRVSKALPSSMQKKNIAEMDWWQVITIGDNFQVTCTPARHFSGRGLKRNGSLWASFVVKLDGYNIYIGSDSGYDNHFKQIGDKYGSFDLAILECGQYNEAWGYIHSMPEELITEAKDLNAKVIMPVHWAKFALALHSWNEPVERFVKAAEASGTNYTTPMIGEPVVLDENYPKQQWWK